MMTMVLSVIQALTFVVILGRNGDRAMLHYPVVKDVHWVEVCIETEGYDPKNPNAPEWYNNSCHEPTFSTEEYRLRPGTVTLKAHLEISEDSHHFVLHTPVIQVRPRPER